MLSVCLSVCHGYATLIIVRRHAVSTIPIIASTQLWRPDSSHNRFPSPPSLRQIRQTGTVHKMRSITSYNLLDNDQLLLVLPSFLPFHYCPCPSRRRTHNWGRRWTLFIRSFAAASIIIIITNIYLASHHINIAFRIDVPEERVPEVFVTSMASPRFRDRGSPHTGTTGASLRDVYACRLITMRAVK